MSAGDKTIIVIGGGPAGYTAAIRAAQLGAAVTLVERDAAGGLGGTCLHRGCIPTKTLLHSANLLHSLRQAPSWGISLGSVAADFPAMMKRKQEVVGRLHAGLNALMRKNRIQVVSGTAQLLTSRKVAVKESGAELSAEALILAPGSKTKIPPFARNKGLLTSDQALSLSHIPQSLVVVGGGVVGLELALLYHRLGARVTVVEMMPQLLPGEDSETAGMLTELLRQDGMEIFTSASVSEIRGDGEKRVSFTTPEGQIARVAQEVLVAVGREPACEGLGLEAVGIKTEGGRVVVTEEMETSVPGVFAAGDVVGRCMLAHAAMLQGKGAAERALGLPFRMDYRLIPRCVFTSPELASVGLTEKEAQEITDRLQVSRFPLSACGKAQILGQPGGLVKVIASAQYGEILGVHILGPGASELIGEAALAMRLEATVQDWASAIHPHPTVSEALGEACLGLCGGAILL